MLDITLEQVAKATEKLSIIVLLAGAIYVAYKVIDASRKGVWVWGSDAKQQNADLREQLRVTQEQLRMTQQWLVACQHENSKLLQITLRGNFLTEKTVQLAEQIKDGVVKTLPEKGSEQ